MSAYVDICVCPKPGAQLLDVCMSFPNTAFPKTASAPMDAGSTLLRFPVWTPGSYVLREHARYLQDIRVENLENQALPFEWLSKNRLRVDNQGQAFHLHYSLWAAELSVRTNHVDDSHAFLNGAASFFFSEETRSLPHSLRLRCPEGWTAACALPRLGDSYLACNFDALVDSPVEMGPHATPLGFCVLGIPHEVVWWGKRPSYMDKLLLGLQKICTTQAQFFGSLPFERFLFIVHAPDKGHGGLEHRACSTLLFGQENLAQENGLEHFLGLASHEYFHAWNVKRMMPPAFQRLDYEQECYTRMLWALEGGSSYYEKLLNFRAGLLSENRLLQLWSETLSELASSPGRFKMTLEEASFLAWIHHYRPHAHSRNTGVSYYVKGEVVCLLLDLSLRQLTCNQRSLDDVFRLLWQRVQKGETLEERAFETAAVQVACAPMEAFFNHALRSTEELDLSCLQHVGLEAHWFAQAPSLLPCLGMQLQDNTVRYVQALGAACQAGLQPGDELVALEGQKFSLQALTELLEQPLTGAPVELHCFRRGRLYQTQVFPRPAPKEACVLRPVDNPSPAQQRAFQGWLQGLPQGEAP